MRLGAVVKATRVITEGPTRGQEGGGGHRPTLSNKKIQRRISVGWEQALRLRCHAFVAQMSPVFRKDPTLPGNHWREIKTN